MPLDTLLAADVVPLHARLTPENRRMFSRDRFAQMRPGACFINTARESLVDERALRQALEEGALGGAALDVLERTPDRHPLLDLPNVFVTPHIGGATAEARYRGAQRAVTAVTELLACWAPANVVNPQVLQAQSYRGVRHHERTVPLAIDAGTGCRAVLFTETGGQAGAGQREWTHHEPPGVPGGQDFDVRAGWQAIAACIRDALSAAGATGGEVAAVAATSMREGMVLYDADGRNTVAHPAKLRTLAELARDHRILVAVDEAANAAAHSAAAVAAGSTLGIMVEVDTGMDRCGVDTARDCLALARQVTDLPGLRFEGITGYEGHCSLTPDSDLRHERQREAMTFFTGVADLLESNGIPCTIRGWAVLPPGSGRRPIPVSPRSRPYVVMDNFHGRMVPGFEHSLTIQATVISLESPPGNVDAGNKSVAYLVGRDHRRPRPRGRPVR